MPYNGLVNSDRFTSVRASARASSSVRLLHLIFTILLLAGLFFSLQANAEEKLLGAAILSDQIDALPLSPHTIVQPDPNGLITPQSIMAAGAQNLNGKYPKGKLVSLGYDGNPVWLTIKLHNASIEEGWIVDMGEKIEGRLGHIASAQAYTLSFN
ncbi:MAG: hypothetical protein DI551_03285, partial [Micavibrio aeruginosavorus]